MRLSTKLKESLWFKYLILSFIISAVLSILALLFAQNFTFLGWINALSFGGLLTFAFGWMLIISNQGLFDVVNYGVKKFWLNIFGRDTKKDLIEYRESKKIFEAPVILSFMIIGLLFLIIPRIFYYL